MTVESMTEHSETVHLGRRILARVAHSHGLTDEEYPAIRALQEAGLVPAVTNPVWETCSQSAWCGLTPTCAHPPCGSLQAVAAIRPTRSRAIALARGRKAVAWWHQRRQRGLRRVDGTRSGGSPANRRRPAGHAADRGGEAPAPNTRRNRRTASRGRVIAVSPTWTRPSPHRERFRRRP
jgi:hypothetical protein